MRKYYIITFGCAMNFSDSERIAAILEQQGMIKVASKYEADLVVIVACAVRQHAVDRIYGNIGEIQNHSPAGESKIKIIITGCLLEKDLEKIKKQRNIETKKLSEFIVSAKKNGIDKFFEISPKYQCKEHACVPIMTGCDNFCSYCAVPYARGREYSRPAEEIIDEITCLVQSGCKEITLLGQNVNSYKSKIIRQPANQKSNLFNFPKLLYLINAIPGDFKIKFLTSHPKDMSNELIDTIARCEKVDREKLHLPIQSGDNEILAKMNRKYTVEHYKDLAQKIRSELPDIKISTDIIVGFPGETEKHFGNTVKLFKEIGFFSAYISCYSHRSGTAAAKLEDDVELREKKRRKEILEQAICKNNEIPLG